MKSWLDGGAAASHACEFEQIGKRDDVWTFRSDRESRRVLSSSKRRGVEREGSCGCNWSPLGVICSRALLAHIAPSSRLHSALDGLHMDDNGWVDLGSGTAAEGADEQFVQTAAYVF